MEFATSRWALIVLLAACWMPAAASAQDACQSMAAQIRSNGLPPLHKSEPKRLKEVLPGNFRPSPKLRSELAKLAGISDVLDLRHTGHGGLHAAFTSEGSANCQGYVFFQLATDGGADLVADPPIIVNGRDGKLMFCTGFGVDSAIGEMAGVPAFIAEIGQDQDEEVRFTPWHDGAWQQECRVAVRFAAEFTVDESYCQGVDCNALSAWVREVVMRYDKNPGITEQLLKPDAKYLPLLSGPAELPTFGQSSLSLQGFGDRPSMAWEVVRDDKHYVARLGHGQIGWREYPDYVLALYRPKGDELEPVAGFHIDKSLGKPVEVNIVK